MEPNETILAVTFMATDVVMMARMRIDVANVATYLLQSHVDTITYEVYESNTLIDGGSFLPADVIFNTLQANPPNTIWPVDKKGFNFKASLARTFIPDGGKAYFVPIKFKLLSSGKEFYLRYKIKTQELSR